MSVPLGGDALPCYGDQSVGGHCGAATAVTLTVLGTGSARLNGTYGIFGEHHGRLVFRKDQDQDGCLNCDTDSVPVPLVYFWDDGDGAGMSGWWIGPEIGGDQVWCYNENKVCETPPGIGWRIPWDGPVNASVRIRVSSPVPAVALAPASTPAVDAAIVQINADQQAATTSVCSVGLTEDASHMTPIDSAPCALQVRATQAVAAVRAMTRKLAVASHDEFQAVEMQLNAELDSQHDYLGTNAVRIGLEVRDAVEEARRRLRESAISEVRERVDRLRRALRHEDDIEALRVELEQLTARRKVWLSVERAESEASDALQDAQRTIELASIETVRRSIRRLSSATPETFESLSLELEVIQADEQEKIRCKDAHRLEDEAFRALAEAQRNVKRLADDREADERDARSIRLAAAEVLRLIKGAREAVVVGKGRVAHRGEA
eukprot:TRINITY_DN20842_c0_g1_i2.p1 TRINITY_DN20842_c0_g1~~TRINITY_DN20842_c0_g1_i2.p1  ORF type:complete len:435 (+),score=79.28 TRINITY_DN20842_c0_g1_i2:86-1390(+)